MKLTILGTPTTKKNSQRILRGRGGRPFVAQSAQHNAWAESAILQARAAYRRGTYVLSVDKRRGHIEVGHPVGPLNTPVNLRALVYRERNTGDLGNYLAAICDVLERAGVVENDRLILGFDGSRLHVDKANPRVELELTPLEVEVPICPTCNNVRMVEDRDDPLRFVRSLREANPMKPCPTCTVTPRKR